MLFSSRKAVLAIPRLLVFSLKTEETTARQKEEPGEFATLLKTESFLVFPFKSRRNIASGYKNGISSPETSNAASCDFKETLLHCISVVLTSVVKHFIETEFAGKKQCRCGIVSGG